MASAWELDIPSTEKMVLLCLCDYAGDDGACWPSVPTIARKCSKGDRTVQAAIQWLRNEGYCTWDETPGKPHRFRLDPRKICATTPAEAAPSNPRNSRTPAKIAPPQLLHATPASSADEPLREPSLSSEAKASSPRAWALPAGVSLQVWQDFLTNRKRKRLPNTDTSWKTFCDDLARVALQTGIPPPKLIEICTGKGWGSINDPRNERDERSSNPTGDALARVQAAIRGGSAFG
jgi:hypothetical protein